MFLPRLHGWHEYGSWPPPSPGDAQRHGESGHLPGCGGGRPWEWGNLGDTEWTTLGAAQRRHKPGRQTRTDTGQHRPATWWEKSLIAWFLSCHQVVCIQTSGWIYFCQKTCQLGMWVRSRVEIVFAYICIWLFYICIDVFIDLSYG